MKVVLDTNVLVSIVGRRSMHHHVFLALLAGEIELCVTTEILNEYAEVLERKLGSKAAEAVVELMIDLPKTHFVRTDFQWNLIVSDVDDNKFADCAANSGARWLVSEDRSFRVLKKVKFPKIEVIRLEDFSQIFNKKQE